MNRKSDLPFGQDMVAAREVVSLTTLRAGLAARGVHYPSGGKHPSMMRLWLAKAGVFVGKSWQINSHRVEDILGLNSSEFAGLADFTPEQRAFLRALANTGTTAPQPANEIVRLTTTYRVKFPEKTYRSLSFTLWKRRAISRQRKTTTGRGAKPFQVAPTDKLIADVVEPLLEQFKNQTDPKLLALRRTPLTDILSELAHADRHVAPHPGGPCLQDHAACST